MRLDAPFQSMPDWPKRQVALVNMKGGFGLGQLNIGLAERIRRRVGDIAPEKIAPLCLSGPFTPLRAFCPGQLRRSVGARSDIDHKETRCAAVLLSQATNLRCH